MVMMMVVRGGRGMFVFMVFARVFLGIVCAAVGIVMGMSVVDRMWKMRRRWHVVSTVR